MKRLALIFSILVVAVCAFSRTTRDGLTKTRGRLDESGRVIPGTPLGGVTIIMDNDNTIESAPSGNFIMTIAGDSFRLKEVSKPAYILSDSSILSNEYLHRSGGLFPRGTVFPDGTQDSHQHTR